MPLARSYRFILLVVSLTLLTIPTLSQSNVIYVDINRSGGNGSSWAQAYRNLQDALLVTQSGDEIWMARGIYYPDSGGGRIDDDRNSTFRLKNGVAIYGGFLGTETARNQRDFKNNETILSGDLDQDSETLTTSAYHVVTTSNTNNSAILDGFTIRDGYHSAVFGSAAQVTYGSGIFNENGSPTLQNLIVRNNAADHGGGISIQGGNPIIKNSTIVANFCAFSGCGLYIKGGQPLLENLIVQSNGFNGLAPLGGSSGGGMKIIDSNPIIQQSLITGNYGGSESGISLENSDAIIENVTISSNTSIQNIGNGIYMENGSNPIIENTIIWGNNGTQVEIINSNPTFNFNLSSDVLPGNNNIVGVPRFVSYPGTPSSGTTAGDFRLQPLSFAIDAGNSDAISTTLDLAGNDRFHDDTGMINVGTNTTQDAVVDIGAYEFQSISVATVLHVNSSSTGPFPFGTTWGDAFGNLQDALYLGTRLVFPVDIWVTGGTYYPDEGIVQTNNDRNSSFQLVNDVEVYGGFTGSESSRSQRDIVANPTILSGDVDKDGTLDADNVYHVVTGNSTNGSAILDGFTIENGYANGQSGGGFYNNNGNPTLRNLTIQNNYALSGGGVFTSGGTLTDSTIIDNTAASDGGGIQIASGTTTALSRVTIESNIANENGGGVDIVSGASANLDEVTIIDNAAQQGGGAHNTSDDLVVSASTIGNNRATHGGGIFTASTVSPMFDNITIENNIADANGGGIYNANVLNTGSTLIQSNHADFGGGIYSSSDTSTQIHTTTILGNYAKFIGGGIYTNDNSTVEITNSLLSGNAARYFGGGSFSEGTMATLTNVTTSGNAADVGAGIYNSNTMMRVQNSILWGNNALTQIDTLFNNSNSSTSIQYSLIEGGINSSEIFGTVNDDGNNNSGDPLFVDLQVANLDNPTTAGDYRIQPGSSAIDAANSDLISVLTDLAGNDRFVDDLGIQDIGVNNTQDAVIDMGAYESQTSTTRAGIIYVDPSNNSTLKDGNSWATAYVNLQDALVVAGSGAEIWVANGTYYPDEGFDQTNDDLNSTFNLKDNVAIYGGFSGLGATEETTRDQRDPDANVVILNGDIDKNNASSNNAYHVVSGVNVGNSTILDGVQIRGGRANGSGNLGRGGGIYLQNSSLTVMNIRVYSNIANRGGGIYIEGGSPVLINLNVDDNTASSGAGVYTSDSNAKFINTMVRGNSTSSFGGGMLILGQAPILVNVAITGNVANSSVGGGMAIFASANVKLNHVTISGNFSDLEGGGIYNVNSRMTIDNSVIWGNDSADNIGDEILNRSSGLDAIITITSSLIEGGIDGSEVFTDVDPDVATVNNGGNIAGDPRFVDYQPASQFTPFTAGDYQLQPTSDALNQGDISLTLDEITLGVDVDGDGTIETNLDVDIARNPRLVDTNVEMGSYEYQFDLDKNGDTIISPVDAIFVINRIGGFDANADVNGDGIVNNVDVSLIQAAFDSIP